MASMRFLPLGDSEAGGVDERVGNAALHKAELAGSTGRFSPLVPRGIDRLTSRTWRLAVAVLLFTCTLFWNCLPSRDGKLYHFYNTFGPSQDQKLSF